MARYRPDIKPPMWGPPAAVQYAVRENAKRLGIDYAKSKLLYAFWEGAGRCKDLMSLTEADPFYGGGQWDSNSFDATDTSGLFTNIYNNSLILDGSLSLTVTFDRYIENTAQSTNVVLAVRDGWNSGTQIQIAYDTLYDSWALGRPSNIVYVADPVANIANKETTVTFLQSGSTFYVFRNGALIGSSSGFSFNPSALPGLPITIAAKRDGGVWSEFFRARIKYLHLSSDILERRQIEQLHAAPYALLMPVSRPVYFDLGAGGGTALTILQALQSSIATDQITLADLSAGIATTGTHSHDLSAALATSGTVSNDLSSLVSTSGAGSQDLQASIATSATLQQALQAAIATEIQTSADLLLTVSGLIGTVVSQDLRLSIATAQTGHADLQTSIATLGEIRQGLQLAVATSLTTLHDTSIQIAELVGSIVRQDLRLTVATELQQAQAVALSVASEASTVQAAIASIATEQTATAPLTVEVSTLLQSLADLDLRIESIVTSVVSQDLHLEIATELAVLQDLRLMITTELAVLPELFEAVCPVSTEFTAVCPVSTEFTAVCPVGLRS